MACLGDRQSTCNILASGRFTRTLVSDMNNLYVISNGDPIQSADEVGPFEGRYDRRGIDDSLPLDLDNSEGKEKVEHRYHRRFQLSEDAFALIRPFSAGPLKIQGKSMGRLACEVFNARPAKLGKIDNISMGGLMFHYVDSMIKFNEALVLDILLAGCGFYLANIPYKTVTDVVIPEEMPGDPIEMRQVRLQFQKLNVNQRSNLNDFLLNHGAENGDLSINE